MKRALRSTVTLAIVASLTAGAAACGKKDNADGAGAATSASDCDKLGERTVAQSMGDTPPGMGPAQVKALHGLAEEAGKAIATHCKEDGWSAKAIQCGLTSKQPQVECDALITPDQKQKMTRAVQQVFEKGSAALMEAMTPPTTDTPPTAETPPTTDTPPTTGTPPTAETPPTSPPTPPAPTPAETPPTPAPTPTQPASP
jgi:hypothetical protein